MFSFFVVSFDAVMGDARLRRRRFWRIRWNLSNGAAAGAAERISSRFHLVAPYLIISPIQAVSTAGGHAAA
ncbi:hypothetical protein ACVBGC_14970 [Burkholderia stagnalis]